MHYGSTTQDENSAVQSSYSLMLEPTALGVSSQGGQGRQLDAKSAATATDPSVAPHISVPIPAPVVVPAGQTASNNTARRIRALMIIGLCSAYFWHRPMNLLFYGDATDSSTPQPRDDLLDSSILEISDSILVGLFQLYFLRDAMRSNSRNDPNMRRLNSSVIIATCVGGLAFLAAALAGADPLLSIEAGETATAYMTTALFTVMHCYRPF